jgi:hypothetical protein
VLVFSFLGFTEQEITVKQTGIIDVKLNSTSSNLNEVVVIGFAKARKKKRCYRLNKFNIRGTFAPNATHYF